MQIGAGGHLLHLYYGPRTEGTFIRSLVPADHGFSMNPYDLREGRCFSADQFPLEYPGSNIGDFRVSALDLITDTGICGCDLRVREYAVEPGAYRLQGLPAARDPEKAGETLRILLADEASGMEAELLYGVFPETDVITRAVRLYNGGKKGLTLLAAASAWGVAHTLAGWRFYPRMTGTTSPWELAPYAALSLLPTAMVLADRLVWGRCP